MAWLHEQRLRRAWSALPAGTLIADKANAVQAGTGTAS